MNKTLIGFIFILFVGVTFSTIIFYIATFSRKKSLGRIINDMDDLINENEDILKNLSTKSANIEKEGIEIRARAIKDGFTKEKTYCKHCGAEIDIDSNFCNKCGKQL